MSGMQVHSLPSYQSAYNALLCPTLGTQSIYIETINSVGDFQEPPVDIFFWVLYANYFCSVPHSSLNTHPNISQEYMFSLYTTNPFAGYLPIIRWVSDESLKQYVEVGKKKAYHFITTCPMPLVIPRKKKEERIELSGIFELEF